MKPPMLKAIFLALALFALSGCATAPRYALPTGATVADGMRVITYCRADAVAKFPLTVALGSPLFGLAAASTANQRQTSIDDCMDTRGFHLCGPKGCQRIASGGSAPA